ncbi:MAG TPA: alpha/beta hydrolase [Baekduia sp.]|nr:alpha/beta hydrolase [Baekduia sp.]
MCPTTHTENASYEDLAKRVLDEFGVAPIVHTVALKRPPIDANVLEYGQGVPTLLLHGGDGESWNFAPLMAQLGDDLHMYAVDRPNFGLSGHVDYRSVRSLRAHAAEFCESVLDALGLDRVVVVGASFGGIFALALAVAHPERVNSVVLPGYAAGVVKRAPWRTRVRVNVPFLPSARAMVQAGRTAAGQKQLHEGAWGVTPGEVPDSFYAARSAGARLPGAEEAWRLLRRKQLGFRGTRPDAYFGDDFPRITQPILQLWGERERNPLEWGRKEIARLPNCRFVLMPDVGHFPYIQAPVQTASLIRDFVRETTNEASDG